jgi:hypothetical protein
LIKGKRPTKGIREMAKAKKVEEVLDDEVEVDEVEETADSVEVFSAKAVATMLGTDGRTLRKFLRSTRGRVGQGNRWEIFADEIDDIRKGFEAFNKPKPAEVKVLLAPADTEVEGDEFEDLIDDEALEIEDLDEIAID